MMIKKDIETYIKEFIDKANELKDASNIFNKNGFREWSFKKLIFLPFYIKPFLNISLNNNLEPLYIDTFSSCGVNEIDGTQFIGSPLISILNGIHELKNGKINKFSKWFFIESEPTFCDALEKRVALILKKVEEKQKVKLESETDVKIICGDCNQKIDEVINKITEDYTGKGKKISVLAFIDPYRSSQIEWNTIEKLYKKLIYVDLIFCFSSGTFKRGLKSIDGEKLKNILPPSLKDKSKIELEELSDDAYEDAFATDIENIARRSITYLKNGITVKNSVNNELYRIMFFTHLNKGVVDKIISQIYDKLNCLKASDLEHLIGIASGKAKSLKSWFK